MVRRLYRFVIAALLGRAWGQKSNRWLSLAGVVMLLRFLDRLASRTGRRAPKN